MILIIYCKCKNPIISARSPVFSHVNATFQGLATIHSSNAEQLLINEFHMYTDLNTSANYLYYATSRALAMWLELICVVYISTITLSFLLFNQQNGNKDKFSKYELQIEITSYFFLSL